MKSLEEITNETPIVEELDRQYDEIIYKLQEAKQNHQPIDEGLFSSILGGAAGLTFGPAVMGAICDSLGVDKKGALGSLLTSRLILTAVGAKIGWKV